MSTEPALLLPVGSDLYALPLEWTREVVPAPAVTQLVTAPAAVLGLFNLRGQVIPLLDTAALLGTATTGAAAYAVVVEAADGLVGLATTGVPRRGTLGAQAASSGLSGTSGQYRVGQEVATLLDPAVLLTPERISGHDHRDLAGNGTT